MTKTKMTLSRHRFDRRAIDDRRHPQILDPPLVESRRHASDRRKQTERRAEWARISKWTSIHLNKELMKPFSKYREMASAHHR